MSSQGRVRSDALIFDPFAGISGDMLLGALVDLGLDAGWLRSFAESLGLGAEVVVDRVDRSGLECARVRFELPAETEARGLADVLAVIGAAEVSDGTRTTAERVFRRLAEVEAALHGVGVDEIHFHEVGALDSILDVLCAVAGIAELGYRRFYTRPVGVGGGTVDIVHGTYPLPAPATARLLEGLPVRETGRPEECTTPTGAAILAELTEGRRPPGDAIYGRSGYGAGTRDPEGWPNCLRLIECRSGTGGTETALLAVAADIDDAPPEYVAAARDRLLSAGAVDATLSRVDMKKGRQGVRLEALVRQERLDAVLDVLFRGTSTIGVRYWPVERTVLERWEEVVEWRGRRVRIKCVRLPDGGIRRKPELEDVVEAADAAGLTPYEVRLELEAGEPGGSEQVEERGWTE